MHVTNLEAQDNMRGVFFLHSILFFLILHSHPFFLKFAPALIGTSIVYPPAFLTSVYDKNYIEDITQAQLVLSSILSAI